MSRGEQRRSQLRGTGSPTDDRGQPCGLAELSPKQIRERLLGTTKGSRDPITRAEARLTILIETCGALVGVAVGLMLWERVITPALGTMYRPWMDAVGPWLTMFVFGYVFWRIALEFGRRRRWSQICGVYLREGRCAGCGYQINGIEPEADGCVVCPECGAAWQAKRIGDPTAEPAS